MLLAAILAASLVVVLLSTGCRPSLRFGFNDDPGNYALQKQIGAPLRRISVAWSEVEPTPGHWDWKRADARLHALAAAGLRPVLVAVAPPCWSHPSHPCVGTDTGATPPDPSFDAAWGSFTGRLAERYPQVVGIEIWNEENLSAVFFPKADPGRYTELLKVAARAIKRRVPAMPVVSGGLFASRLSGPGGMGDAQFLSAMYAAGAKGSIDAIGVHPYPVADGSTGAPAHHDLGAMELTLARVRIARNAAGGSTTRSGLQRRGFLLQGAKTRLSSASHSRPWIC